MTFQSPTCPRESTACERTSYHPADIDADGVMTYSRPSFAVPEYTTFCPPEITELDHWFRPAGDISTLKDMLAVVSTVSSASAFARTIA